MVERKQLLFFMLGEGSSPQLWLKVYYFLSLSLSLYLSLSLSLSLSISLSVCVCVCVCVCVLNIRPTFKPSTY